MTSRIVSAANTFAHSKNGHQTTVTKADGSIENSTTRPIILDRDLQAIFRDSKAVNKALRGLIDLVPEHRVLSMATGLVSDSDNFIEEYTREMILLEELHLDEVNNLLGKPGEVPPFNE